MDDHDQSETEGLITLRDWLRYAVSRFNQAGLFFGHGTDNAFDEAAYLILSGLHLPHDRLDIFLDACLTPPEQALLDELVERRAVDRVPVAYLTNQAWLGQFSFYVDERVIVPRSYFAELLGEEGLAPWIGDAEAVENVLDLCTGSGCLAILMAHAFPHARVDAIDISADALDVARRNVADYGLEARIELIESDLLSAVADRQYDFVLSNPPYVTSQAMADLPAEYRHEPAIALGSGDDGLDAVRQILAHVKSVLKPHGFVAVEVGHNRDIVEAAFPDLDFLWLTTGTSEDKIFLIRADQLP